MPLAADVLTDLAQPAEVDRFRYCKRPRVGMDTSNAAHDVPDLKQRRGRQYGEGDYLQFMTCYDDCARCDQDSWHKNEDFETR